MRRLPLVAAPRCCFTTYYLSALTFQMLPPPTVEWRVGRTERKCVGGGGSPSPVPTMNEVWGAENCSQLHKVNRRPFWNQCTEVASFMSEALIGYMNQILRLVGWLGFNGTFNTE